MSALELYNSGGHANIFLEDFGIKGEAIPSNQHLIVSNGEAMILDPGGHKVYSKVFAATNRHLSGATLKYIFLSHQDPDIVAALNGWLMTTDAEAMISGLWKRFVMHFGVDSLAAHRIQPIPDE